MLRYSWLSDVKFFRSLGKIHRLADRQKSIDSKIPATTSDVLIVQMIIGNDCFPVCKITPRFMVLPLFSF